MNIKVDLGFSLIMWGESDNSSLVRTKLLHDLILKQQSISSLPLPLLPVDQEFCDFFFLRVKISPTITTADIPLQTRKLSCPPSSRDERLPAELNQAEAPTCNCNFNCNCNANVDLRRSGEIYRHDGDGYWESDVDLDLNPDSTSPSDTSPSLTHRLRVLMSRAPLIRSSPALGSSSYGAVRIPHDSDDEAQSPSQNKKARRTLNAPQRTSLESDSEGPSGDVQHRSSPRRSQSSTQRRSSGWYRNGRNRRPSSAASDVGMGPDSKYSFATGLAVPGNPAMQDTPLSSPYMTSDEEEALDNEDEDSKSSEEDPPDNSPYVGLTELLFSLRPFIFPLPLKGHKKLI